MNQQEFVQAWGGNYNENPLARFRQSLANLQGYGELVLEQTTADGFRPRVAGDLDEICAECRDLTRSLSDLLFRSNSFQEATGNLYRGLHPTIDSMLRQIHRMIDHSATEPFVGDLKNMRSAGQTLRDLLDEVRLRGES